MGSLGWVDIIEQSNSDYNEKFRDRWVRWPLEIAFSAAVIFIFGEDRLEKFRGQLFGTSWPGLSAVSLLP